MKSKKNKRYSGGFYPGSANKEIKTSALAQGVSAKKDIVIPLTSNQVRVEFLEKQYEDLRDKVKGLIEQYKINNNLLCSRLLENVIKDLEGLL